MELTRQSICEANDEILHTGVAHDENPPGRGSGRYEYNSGENPCQHDKGIRGEVARLRKQGLTESQIAVTLGFVNPYNGKPMLNKYKAAVSIEKAKQDAYYSDMIPKLLEDGYNQTQVAKELGCSEGTVRNYIKNGRPKKASRNMVVAEAIKKEVDQKRYLDLSEGSELYMGNINRGAITVAMEILEQQGYKKYTIPVEQLTNKNKNTNTTVLGAPDTSWAEVRYHPELIQPVQTFFQDQGRTSRGLLPVKSIDSKRVYVKYTEEDGSGGAERDGVIQLRRGVEDISLGNSSYSQVRIAVDGTHYMKGMAVYSDNIPDGYDVVYWSNKKKGAEFGEVFKELKKTKDENGKEIVDWSNPFGASIKPFNAGGQSFCRDQNGNETDQLRVINKVNDQGDWADWGKKVSPQLLSKQPVTLAKKQLELTYRDKFEQFKELEALNNPTVKKNLLLSFADSLDSSCSHLKALAFPGQMTQVVIAEPSVKDGEIFAPNYENGQRLALFRFPHAGQFEIAVCTVNNNNKECRKEIGLNSHDAVGVNANTLSILSGADSDGDTVVTIPLDRTNIKYVDPLPALKGFETKTYKYSKEEIDNGTADLISSKQKQTEMGKVTNLITDMYNSGVAFSVDEMSDAVKCSMVVIDSEKHKLDWKRCYQECHIADLKEKYQGAANAGASTFLTRAGSEVHIPTRKAGTVKWVDDDGKEHTAKGIDPRTGKKIWEDEDSSYERKTILGLSRREQARIDNLYERGVSPEDIAKSFGKKTITTSKVTKYLNGEGEEKSKTVVNTTTVNRIDLVDDAYDLMSSRDNPSPMERVYADYANALKTLANESRRIAVNTPRLERSKEASILYKEEVDSLNEKLMVARSNAPREREAMRMAMNRYKAMVKANPDLEWEDKEHLKRLKNQLVAAARDDCGAKKVKVDITDKEWEAIQKGAISDTTLSAILKNADKDQIKKLATPREKRGISDSKKALIRNMYGDGSKGYSLSQIAEHFGISTSEVSKIING